MNTELSNTIYLPEYLKKKWQIDKNGVVDLSLLYVGLVVSGKDKTVYVNIVESPHYMFARYVLFGEEYNTVSGFESYDQYALFSHHACTEALFVELVCSIIRNGYQFECNPILVYRHWRRPFPLGRWDVADGFHRLAILAALGFKRIPVCFLSRRENICQRIFKLMFER